MFLVGSVLTQYPITVGVGVCIRNYRSGSDLFTARRTVYVAGITVIMTIGIYLTLNNGVLVLAGIDKKSLCQAVETAVSLNEDGFNGIPVPDYVEQNVSTKVVKIIQSYTGIVDKMVWRKY